MPAARSLSGRFVWLPLGFALAVAPACNKAGDGEAAHEGNKANAAQAAGKSSETRIDAPRVRVSERPMPAALKLVGSLVANEQADVAANASGQVQKTFVERGSEVREGDPLVQLDMRQVKLSAEEARANLDVVEAQRQLANQQCQRNQALYEKGAISKEEWDRIDNACKSAESQMQASVARSRQASRTLADATVKAPFTGLIGERYVSVGEYVGPQSRVVALTQLNPLRLRIGVPEAYVGAVSLGAKVSFEVEAFLGERFSGDVRFVGPQVRADSRDVVVEALVDNPNGRLRPGMFADVDLLLPKRPQLAVPQKALKKDGEVAHVFVVEHGRAAEHVVSPGTADEGFVAIVRGLKEGDEIVSEIPAGLRDGALISP